VSYLEEAKSLCEKGDADWLDGDTTEMKAEENRYREGGRMKSEMDESDTFEAIPNQDVVRTDEILRILHNLEMRNRCPTFFSRTRCPFDHDPIRSSSFD